MEAACFVGTGIREKSFSPLITLEGTLTKD
jgi:hypothetical protein